MSVKPITLYKNWEMNKRYGAYEMVLTSPFFDTTLPGVVFDIVCGQWLSQGFTVIVSKTPYDPASAIIEIFQNGKSSKMMEVTDWTNKCTLYINCTLFDHISFRCKITWRGFVKKLLVMNLYHIISHLRETPKLAAITIDINNEEIPVHKVILTAQSPVFLAMFETDMKESANNRIIVKDIEVEVMKKVIDFLYTGIIDTKLDVDDVLSILSVADKYQIMHLKDFCVEVLSQKLTVDNVLHILKAASLYTVPKFVEQIIVFMTNKKQEIFKLEDLKDFNRRNPELFFKYVTCISKVTE